MAVGCRDGRRVGASSAAVGGTAHWRRPRRITDAPRARAIFASLRPIEARLQHRVNGASRVAKPNYRFQKQQRELKKNKQKEDKLRKKQERSDATKTAETPQEERK